MATLQLTYEEVAPLIDTTKHSQAKVEIIIGDVIARCVNHVPALAIALDEAQLRSAKAIARTVVVRHLDKGSGAITSHNQSQSTGGFSTSEQITTDNSRSNWYLFPSEIAELKAIVANETLSKGKAFSVDMLGGL